MRDGGDASDLRVRGVRRVNRNGRLCVFCVSRKEDAMTPRQPHSRRRVPAYTAVVLAFLALVGSLGLTTAASASAAPYCGITWGSLTKAGGVETAPNLTGVRTGRHDCYDRLVLDLRGGSSAGFHVSYVDAVYTDASGVLVPLRGGARLQIVVHASSYDVNGHPTYIPANPQRAGERLRVPDLPPGGVCGQLRGPDHGRPRRPSSTAVPGVHPRRPGWRLPTGRGRRPPLVSR